MFRQILRRIARPLTALSGADARFASFLLLFFGLTCVFVPQFIPGLYPRGIDPSQDRVFTVLGIISLALSLAFKILAHRKASGLPSEPETGIPTMTSRVLSPHASYIALTLFVASIPYLILFVPTYPHETAQDIAFTAPKILYFLAFVVGVFVAMRWEALRPKDGTDKSTTTFVGLTVAVVALGLSVAAKLGLLPAFLR